MNLGGNQREHERRLRRRARGERGYALAFTAIILIPLLAISAMSTDIGGWYDEATEIQKAADAAALAGVVWLPDFERARQVALNSANSNGYDDADPDVVVTVSQPSRTELTVSIQQRNVPIFFASFFIDEMTITREATSSFILPVPLGSPKNYFGTGNLALSANVLQKTATENENMWAAINGWCSPREQGDPFAARFVENWPLGEPRPYCPGTKNNDQYVGGSDAQYEYSINVPAGRLLPIVIHLFHPTLNGLENNALAGNAYGTWNTTFRLRAPDGTPFDDSDNPTYTCTGTGETNPRSYGNGAVPNAVSMWGSNQWTRFCTISPTAPSGTYILGVRSQENVSNSTEINTYGVLASYSGGGAQCDSRTDAMCPTVNPRKWMSVYATASTKVASLFLAEVGAEHAGKTMEITLFDPGEGGQSIEILDPSGRPAKFDFHTTDGSSFGDNQTALDVSDCDNYPQPGRSSKCQFSDRYVVMKVEIPSTYASDNPGSKWWKLRYTFTDKVQDRSTWSVRIIGDPVRLVN